MRIRVLGCSGAIAKDCRTTSFLIDDDTLIDAGTGVGDLTLDEMRRIDRVFLTHSHLDHVAALPLMVDSVGTARGKPLKIHALPETIQALRAHIFNDLIWPDFSRIPSESDPCIQFREIAIGQAVPAGANQVEVLAATHTVAAAGFSVSAGKGCWVFTGDTERNPALWARLNQLDVSMLVIETAFSNRESQLAQRSLHLSPQVLATELENLDATKRFPIYITHTKPAETELIMAEIERFDRAQPGGRHVAHDIHWLRAGDVFVI